MVEALNSYPWGYRMNSNYGSVDTFRLQAMMQEWLPKIVGALVILAIAWAVGTAAKWALAKLIDKIPGLAKHNAGRPENQTVGHQLGSLAYWLILLVGIVAALGVLGLDYIVQPLNALIGDFFAFLPGLIGAALILFIGFIVATLAKRVVESALNVANVDRGLEKAGLTRLTGASGLAKTVGTIVFVMIIIPIAIAALEQLGIRAISDPAVSVLQTVLNALPRVIAAAIVLGIAFVIARWVATLVEQILPSLGLDRSLGALGVFGGGSTPAPTPPPSANYAAGEPATLAQAETATAQPAQAAASAAASVTPSKIISQAVLWAIMLFAATEAARLLGFAAIAAMLHQVLELFGRVLFGGVIIALGVALAGFLSGMVKRSGGGGEGFASTLVRWATIALATAMGLRFMGIADEIVILAFGLILGSAAVAAAIAFGIGGRDPAKRVLEQALQKAESRAGGQPPTPPGSGQPPMVG